MTKTMLALVGAALMSAVGLSAFAAPAVTVNSVTENGTWSTINVTYTLSGVDTSANYKMQFDVTADGVTKTVTDDSFATKSNGSYTKTIDTKTLFDSARRDAKAKVKVSLLDQVDFAAGGQLWAGGPIWAGCNVGATKPEEYGYYFWWGDTVGYVRSGNKWVSSQDGKTQIEFFYSNETAKQTYGKSITWLKTNGWIDDDGNLKAEHDAARAHLKGDWRMPTDDEIQELVNNCNCRWTTLNGVKGYAVTGKDDYATKGIFLPAAGYGYKSSLNISGSHGYYWSSTPDSGYTSNAKGLYSHSLGFERSGYYRYYGNSVRPVRGFAE